MSPVARKLLRILGFSVYGVVVVVVFVASAYGAFNLFVTSGATRVPEVAGLPRAEAADLLADAGLEMEESDDGGRYHPQVPAGHVIEQSPAASTLVKRGAAVGAVVSLGPQRLTVPELEGKSLQSAQVTLAAGGLALGPTLRVFRPGAAAGVVVAQDPDPGELTSPGAEVRVFLAQAGGAPRLIMPDLVYRDDDEVRAFFERAGLKLGRVTFEVYEGAREGTILRQFPLAGHPLTAADAVSLVVAAGDAADDLAGTAAAVAVPRPGAERPAVTQPGVTRSPATASPPTPSPPPSRPSAAPPASPPPSTPPSDPPRAAP
jgi:eukaryotic-like serine/threonine-protein kinase